MGARDINFDTRPEALSLCHEKEDWRWFSTLERRRTMLRGCPHGLDGRKGNLGLIIPANLLRVLASLKIGTTWRSCR